MTKTMTIEKRLAEARKIASDAQMQRARLEAQLENALGRKKEYLDACAKRNIMPEELEAKIDELGEDIEKRLDALENRFDAEEQDNPIDSDHDRRGSRAAQSQDDHLVNAEDLPF